MTVDRAAVARRRLAGLGVLILALLAVFLFLPVPGLPCGLSPAKSCAPDDDAIELVPAGARAYLHLDLDAGDDQVTKARGVSARLPHFGALEQGAFSALGLGRGLRVDRDLGPWIGDEAALAEVGPGPAPLVLLAVGDRKGADAFLAKLGATGNRAAGQLHPLRGRLAYAELGDFLALGSAAAVRAAIATEAGRAPSLADSKPAEAVRGKLPDQRVADAYLSARGIRTLLARGGGFAARLDTFADFAASEGIAAAVVAHGNGFELQLDSALGPVRARTHPSVFAALPGFDPSLAGEFSSGTLLYLEFANPARAVRALLRQAAASAPQLAAAAGSFENRVRSRGVDIRRDVLSMLGDQAAAGVAAGPSGPYLTLAFEGVDESLVRNRMAELQAPLVGALALSPSRTGQAPSFGSSTLDGVVVNSVRLSPALDLAYAVFGGKLVVSTNPAGVRQAIAGGDDLAGSAGYRAATGGAPGDLSALVFLNLEGLLRSAGPLGLGQAVGGFGADLARLRAVGLSVKSSAESLETSVFLNIE